MISQDNEFELDLDPPSQAKEEQQRRLQQGETTKHYTLKDETIYKLVDHSVGNIALECGYHIAHQSSLDILTDVCCDYLRKIATLFRTSYDTENLRDSDNDFVDSLERVFHQINIPSAANLHQFVCKMQAIKRHQSEQAGKEASEVVLTPKTQWVILAPNQGPLNMMSFNENLSSHAEILSRALVNKQNCNLYKVPDFANPI